MPQRVRHRLTHLIPAHVRHLERQAGGLVGHFLRWEPLHGTREQAQARRPSALFAEIVQGLQTEADAQEGFGFHRLKKGFAQTAVFQRRHAATDSALAGKNHARS